MEIMIPIGAKNIIDILKEKGYKAYLVGGCIRDILLERDPHDFDITTNAPLEAFIPILQKKGLTVIPVGIQMGTVIVQSKKQLFEVSTFKKNKNKKPLEKDLNPLYEDLSLRDFTINAMAYNEKIGLIDPFHGQVDLKNEILRTVGKAEERFMEDPLRILRAIRIATQLGFTIHKDTEKEMFCRREELKEVSIERIREELNKMLLVDTPSKAIKLLEQYKLLDYIIPELKDTIGFEQQNPHHDKDVFNHTLAVLDNTPKDIIVRLAALLHDIGKPKTFTIDDKGIGHFYGHHKISAEMARGFLKRLKYSKKTIKIVTLLVDRHMYQYKGIKDKTLKRFIKYLGEENLERFFQLKRGDILGTKAPHSLEKLEELQEKTFEILKESQALSLKDLKINGNDLIALGIPQGERIGKVLNILLEEVLDNPALNNKEKLLEIAAREKY